MEESKNHRDPPQYGWEKINTISILQKLGINEKRLFITGNEAIALGALIAGCRFYAGYPITPSSEIAEKMAEKLPLLNGEFFQGEDEISSIGMTNAASSCGIKSMTATSGPGLSLKQEDASWPIINEIPLVIIDAQRMGPGTGQPTKSASADINAIINGRHGDAGNCVIVLSPSSPQECFNLVIDAFNLSEQFRTPVFIALDGLITHLSEIVEIPKEVWIFNRKEGKEGPFRFNGKTANFWPIGKNLKISYGGLIHDEYGNRNSFNPEIAKKFIWHLIKKHQNVIPEILRDKNKYFKLWENNLENKDYALISYGITSRAARETVSILQASGEKIGFLCPNIIWPLNTEIFKDINCARKIIVAEANAGQFVEYLYKYINPSKIVKFNKWWGEPITTEELTSFCKKVIQKEKLNILAGINNTNTNDEEKFANEPLTTTPLQLISDNNENEELISVKNKYPFCVGCTYHAFPKIFTDIAAKSGLTAKNTIIVSGIGCAGILGTIFDADIIKTFHGRTLNSARGIKLARPDLNVVVISGDGDLLNIGGGHLLHTARENFDIKVFCFDNCNYGMTGGQPSATTPENAITNLQFSQKPLDVKALLHDGLKIRFFARTSIATLPKVMEKAFQVKGFAFVQVLSICASHFAKNKENKKFISKDYFDQLFGIWENK